MTLFLHFLPVRVSSVKLGSSVRNDGLAVSYVPANNNTRTLPFPKRVKVAGRLIFGISFALVGNANRILDTLVCECEGACLITKGVEINCLRHFKDGTYWWSFYFCQENPILSLPFAGYSIHILFLQHNHAFCESCTDHFMVNITEMLTHAHAIGTRLLIPLLPQPGYKA